MNFFVPITSTIAIGTSLLLLVMNPGIIYSDKKSKENEKIYYHHCKFLYPCSNKKMEHCFTCEICVCKMDHHCGVIGKCVGKYNLIIFFFFIINVMGFMICITFTLSHFLKILFERKH